MYRGQVASAIRGKRGQALLRSLKDALEAMPAQRLGAGWIESAGDVCALGALGRARGMDMQRLGGEDNDGLAREFGVAHQLIAEIEFENDEVGWSRTPEERWQRMHAWVCSRIAQEVRHG